MRNGKTQFTPDKYLESTKKVQTCFWFVLLRFWWRLQKRYFNFLTQRFEPTI